MESDRIELKVLAWSAAVILVVEGLWTTTFFLSLGPHLAVVGLARLMEILGLLLVVYTWGHGPGDLGLAGSGLKPGLKTGLLWSAVFGLCALVGLVGLTALGLPPARILGGHVPADFSKLALLMLVGGLVAPVAEEIFFRGVLFGYLRRWGAPLGLIVSTLVFVLAHGHMPGPPPIPQAVGGLVFGLAYEKTGQLMVPITIHVLGNLAIFTLLIWFSPQI